MAGQCEATVTFEKSPNYGEQCQRAAVNGSSFCSAHGGLEDTTTPEAVRKRLDRPGVKCTAHNQNGEPCGNYAIAGGAVCTVHGGDAPQVREAARQRLLAMVHPALDTVFEIMLDPRQSGSDRLRAAFGTLNRGGFPEKAEIAVDAKPWEGLIDVVLRKAEADDDAVVEDAEIDEAEVVEDDEAEKQRLRELTDSFRQAAPAPEPEPDEPLVIPSSISMSDPPAWMQR